MQRNLFTRSKVEIAKSAKVFVFHRGEYLLYLSHYDKRLRLVTTEKQSGMPTPRLRVTHAMGSYTFSDGRKADFIKSLNTGPYVRSQSWKAGVIFIKNRGTDGPHHRDRMENYLHNFLKTGKVI